jgi:hypothetical protein
LHDSFETAFTSLLVIVEGRSGGNGIRWKTSGRLRELFGVVSKASWIDTLKCGQSVDRVFSSEDSRLGQAVST